MTAPFDPKRVSAEDWMRFAAMAPPVETQTLFSMMKPGGQTLEGVQAFHVAAFADELARQFLERYPEEGR